MFAIRKNRKAKIVAGVLLGVAAVIGGFFLFSSQQMKKVPSMTFEEMLQYTTENKEDALITVGIIKDGKQTYTVYGEKGKVLPSKEYNYEIGSISKTFTTSLLSKAVSEGKLSLDNRIDQHLPLPEKDYYPTLKRLVTHTSGYKGTYFDWQLAANYLSGEDNPYYSIPRESLLESIWNVDLTDKDYSFKYSNFGISVVGEVLSEVYDEDFHSLMNRFIREDLQLKNTKVSINLEEILGSWRWKKDDAYLAAGALVSNIHDMLTYLELHMTEAQPYLALTHETLAKADGNTKKSLQIGMRIDAQGMGWIIDKKNGLIWHNGATRNSNNSYLAFDKKRQIGVVILSNLDPDYRIPATVMGTKLITSLQKEYDASPKAEEKEDLPVGDSTQQFALSQNEEIAYDNFEKDFDLKHLNGLAPISVARLYLKAGAEKKYDLQYAFYTDRAERILWSKEEDAKIPESDRGNIKDILVMFKNLSKGTFKQTSDDEGYIEFESADGSGGKSGFKMVKNENGVWQVDFMPIQ